jgi:hypothetical protein
MIESQNLPRAPIPSSQGDPECFTDVSTELQKDGQKCLSFELQTFIKFHRLGEDYPAFGKLFRKSFSFASLHN